MYRMYGVCATGIACRKEVEDGEILEASASGIMSDVSVDDDSAGCLTTGRTFRTGRKCCSGQMLSDHLGVTDHGHGRESNKWLLENRSKALRGASRISLDLLGRVWGKDREACCASRIRPTHQAKGTTRVSTQV